MPQWIIQPAASDADPTRIATHAGVQRFPHRLLTLFQQKQFLSDRECSDLIARIDAGRRPSTLADHNGDTQFRTSETCHLDGAAPVVAAIDARICAYLGIDSRHGEPIQGQYYSPGQEFKPHTDYFDPTGVDFLRFCTVSGNRTWTAMIYLNEPEAGGATRFTSVSKTIQPQLGKMLLWDNRLPDGTLNPHSIHHGMKVRSGVKYIITKWFRELPWGHNPI